MLRYASVAFAILVSFLAAGVEEETITLHKEVDSMCQKEFDVSREDHEKARKNFDFSSLEPCFIACLLKGKHVIDSKGMFDKQKTNEVVEKIVDSPAVADKMKKILANCESVNEKAVSDGDKGCERSVFLVQCMVDGKSTIV